LSYYLTRKFNSLKVSKVNFILVYVFFHLIYIVSEFLQSKYNNL
jgi:hypothetical protein